MSVTENTRTESSGAVLELKSSSVTLPALKLMRGDLDTIASSLSETIERAPDFFHNAPVVLDLHAVVESGEVLDITLLVSLLRGQGLIPIGVRGGTQTYHEAAQTMGLAIFAEGGGATAVRKDARVSPRPDNGTGSNARIIRQPVRSGQRVYATGGDLIVLAPVSPGAELMADGNIHVYSTLRGRALAGVSGDLNTRIFCSNLDAELVSISGHYRVSEGLDPSMRGKSVQIHLNDGTLVVDEL